MSSAEASSSTAIPPPPPDPKAEAIVQYRKASRHPQRSQASPTSSPLTRRVQILKQHEDLDLNLKNSGSQSAVMLEPGADTSARASPSRAPHA